MADISVLHSWIKAALIKKFVTPGTKVVDLGCGDGGDLKKYQDAKVETYVGLDISRESIKKAITMNKRGRYSFFVQDCFSPKVIEDQLSLGGPFQVCSSHSVLQFSWCSEDQARQMLKNVSMLLEPGGYFIGTVPDADIILDRRFQISNNLFRIEFESFGQAQLTENPFGLKYDCKLNHGLNGSQCSEWLVYFPKLRAIANEYGLELVTHLNFVDFVALYSSKPEYQRLMTANVNWSMELKEHLSLYCAFAFRKQPASHNGPQVRSSMTNTMVGVP